MAKDSGDKKVEGDEPEAKKKGKGKLIIIGVVVAALAAGAYVVGTKSAAPADSAAAAGESTTTTTIPLIDGCVEEPEPGAPEQVVDLPQMSINLTDGHYLRVSVSLGICADVVFPVDAESGKEEELGTAPALDIIVSTLSGMSMEVLSTSEGRTEAKEALKEKISAMYPAVVYEVFFLEFVMQ
jgi:flagellar basal body-associated protein FliL